MYNYCAIYVFAPLPLTAVIDAVAAATGGATSAETILAFGLVIDVLENDDYDENLASGSAGDFLFYPYRLEIEPEAEVARDEMVRRVTRLLVALRTLGFDYATAADYEEELPRKERTRPLPRWPPGEQPPRI